jgi:hypothetical protein
MIFTRSILTNPLFDVATLEKRQMTLGQIESLLTSSKDIDSHLATLKKTEADFLWMYQEQNADIASLYNMVFFKAMALTPLNYRPEVLTSFSIYRIVVSPLIGVITPIMYFIIPFIILRIKLKLKIGFVEFLKLMLQNILSGSSGLMSAFPRFKKFNYLSYVFSLLFYFQGMFNSVELAKAVHSVSSLLTAKMNNVIQFIQSAEALYKAVATATSLPGLEKAFDFGDPVYANGGEFDGVAKPDYSIFSNFGTRLKYFKFFKKESYLCLLRKTYLVDALVSICKAKQHHNMCPVKYLNNVETPVLNLIGAFHPSIQKAKVVGNNIALGTKTNQQLNMVLTGPNAGGKSTLIKSVLLSIIFAQTITMSNATECEMSPIYYINSQMNIPDCKGKESLFEAEMYRSKENLDVLDLLDGKRFSAIFMDEIFNSTNPIEGIAGAYAIAKHMASRPTNMTFITTHYVYLAKLAKEFPDKFANFKMNVVIGKEDGSAIRYPYKMSKGVSRQYIALELLKQNGFDKAVVTDAIAIKKKLLAMT